ncbi:MAG: endolytic transglycosylase MltG [Patescibacteria group bacterium]|nr:endolytic transglycosylase MltG [Patescibacteria group bacterium]
MLKKILASSVIFLVLVLAAGIFVAKKVRLERQAARQSAKAPEETVTIIEGWAGQDIAYYLEKKGVANAKDFLDSIKSYDVAKYPLLADKPENADLEGYLFPDTYRISKSDKNNQFTGMQLSSQLIGKMLDNFNAKFTPEMRQAAKDRNMSVYQIITLASIIEKESGNSPAEPKSQAQLDQERATIAGVFYNRLKIGQPLESDATINFITNKNDPAASSADLSVNSPYNTYKYAGLPPGPICNPSLSSIKAALNPIQSDYYYFLHKQPSGEAVFSKTFAEHVQNKLKYLK